MISQSETQHQINKLIAQAVFDWYIFCPIEEGRCIPCCKYIQDPTYHYVKYYLCNCRFKYFSSELPDWDGDLFLAMDRVLPAMTAKGYSFGLWSTHEFSSILYGVAAASFRRSVYPPEYNHLDDSYSRAHSITSVSDAICKAALLALKVEFPWQ